MTDQYQFNGAQGAVMDQGSGNGGTYPDQGAVAPSQQQMFPQEGMPQQQPPYQPQQQFIDPEQHRQAMEALAYYQQQNAELESRQHEVAARQALSQSEYRRQQEWERARAEARQLINDDPERALAMIEEKALAERRERQGDLVGVLQAAGRAIQHMQMQQQVPQLIGQAQQQYGQFGQDAEVVLRNLPPEHIPAVANLLGKSVQQVRQYQQQLQQQHRVDQRTQMQQSGAHRAPAVQGAPSQGEPEDGSREQLAQAMELLGLM